MTDPVHAFDEDGTPSPGAQIALDSLRPSWDTLDGKPDTFTPATHTHVVKDVDGLQDALDDATTGLATETYVDDAVTGIPEATTEAAGLMTADDKTFVDAVPTQIANAQQAAIARARVPALFTYGSTSGHRYSHFRTFAGRPTPGLVTKRFATTDDQATEDDLVPTPETPASFTRRTGAPVVLNASGWKVSGNVGELRGAQIYNGQVFHDFEDFETSPAGVDAMGIKADGTIKMYSKRWGDTAESMVDDGVIESVSYGPVLVLDGDKQDLTDERWAYFRTEKSARQIVGTNALGELMATTVTGDSTDGIGLTAPEAATLAVSLGYDQAVLMDGGASAQAQAGTIQVMPSSNEDGERAVPDALCVNAMLLDPTVETEWVDCEMGDGFTAQNGNPPQVKRIGNVVYMRRGVTSDGMEASTGPEGVFTVPAAFLPDGWRYANVTGSTVSNGGMAVIREGGKVQIRTAPTLSPYFVFEQVFWPLG